jgi:hypothetical protein
MKTLPKPWTVAMEATIFSGWIYDYLLPHSAQIKVAHRLMLRAIAAAKKKNDRIDAGKLADCLRCEPFQMTNSSGQVIARQVQMAHNTLQSIRACHYVSPTCPHIVRSDRVCIPLYGVLFVRGRAWTAPESPRRIVDLYRR